MRIRILLPLLLAGCVAKSGYVDRLARNNDEQGQVLVDIATKLEDPIIIYKATEAKKDSAEIAKTSSNIANDLPESLPNWLIYALGPAGGVVAAGYGLFRAGKFKQLAHEVADMQPDQAKERLKT